MQAKQLFNQMDPKWKDHVLGWGPALGTIGAFGCFNCVLAMVAVACGLNYPPATLDELFTKLKIFVKDPTGTFDMLPSDALDRAFPGKFKSVRYAGFRGDLILAARKSKDTFAAVQVVGYSPLWGMVIKTHFVLMAGAGPSIADPEGGVVRLLSAYGGPGAVQETIIIKHLAAAPAKPVPVTVTPPATPAASSPVGQDVLPTPPAQAALPPCPIPLPTPPPSTPPSVNAWQVILAQLLALLKGH
jgi:hypothetical protein